MGCDQSLSLNLFLSRIEPSGEELVEYIEEGDDKKVGHARLRYLMTCLPTEEEVRAT